MKQWLLNYLIRKFYNTVTTSDIITIEKGVICVDGKKVTDEELRGLKAEEKALTSSRLWKLMIHSTRHVAEKKLITDSTQLDHVVAGKTMLINLDTIESIARVVKNH